MRWRVLVSAEPLLTDSGAFPRRIELEARDPARNCHRRWSLQATVDLFGACVVEIAYGRIGADGQRIVHSFSDETAALRYIKKALARRRAAPGRIGVRYRVLLDTAGSD